MPETPNPPPHRSARHALRAGAMALTLALGGTGSVRAADEPAASASAPAAASAPRTAASAPRAAASVPQTAPQQVEITGTSAVDSQAERRRSTASKIVYGREELDRMGDATLGDVLKRLPGVTLGGPPGRGGQIRMRGMGGGYTQILIDGQRMPPGFSLDQVVPEQIERIEIMRAPVAETGTRAIAGTINVIMRADFKRKQNELRFGGGVEGELPRGSATWLYTGENDTLGYNITTTLFGLKQATHADTHIYGTAADGRTNLDQQLTSDATTERRGLFASSRLQFKLAPGNTLDVQPFVNFSDGQTAANGTLLQTVGIRPAPYASSAWTNDARNLMARLNNTWLFGTAGGGRMQLRLNAMLAQADSQTNRLEFDDAGALSATRVDDNSQRDLSIDTNGKFSQLIAERHSVALGYELQANRRNDTRTLTENGVPQLTDFGDTVTAQTLRAALYAQDEWDWSKTFSFYVGARWEGIRTVSDSASSDVNNTSSVLTPLAHMVWRLPDAPRDQVRLSLTRSYKSPTTAQLIALPVISTLYPDLDRPNEPTSPDRAGNPYLKPELAWGIDLAFEHYLDAGGIVSANLFGRQIDDLIRTVRNLEVVEYASVPRWVARPQNIGSAVAAGLELEAKLRAADLWTTELPLTLRGNATLMWSRVEQVEGPNNRLDQQPKYTLNLGADYPLRGMPLTLGGNFNYTPAFIVQQIDSQTYRQGVKQVFDFYGLWRFSPAASARLSIGNAGARPFDTGTTTLLADGSSQSTDVSARSYTQVTLRAELRF